MRTRMYGGVRGRKTKVGGKPTFVFLLLDFPHSLKNLNSLNGVGVRESLTSVQSQKNGSSKLSHCLGCLALGTARQSGQNGLWVYIIKNPPSIGREKFISF